MRHARLLGDSGVRRVCLRGRRNSALRGRCQRARRKGLHSTAGIGCAAGVVAERAERLTAVPRKADPRASARPRDHDGGRAYGSPSSRRPCGRAVPERYGCRYCPRAGAWRGGGGRALGDAGLEHNAAHGVLQQGLVQVVVATLARLALGVDARRGKHPLPGPLAAGVGQLARERVGQLDPARGSAKWATARAKVPRSNAAERVRDANACEHATQAECPQARRRGQARAREELVAMTTMWVAAKGHRRTARRRRTRRSVARGAMRSRCRNASALARPQILERQLGRRSNDARGELRLDVSSYLGAGSSAVRSTVLLRVDAHARVCAPRQAHIIESPGERVSGEAVFEMT